MGNDAVKTIVLAMVLVVLSVLVGAQISDGLRGSFGAFATIGGVVALFLMLLLGKNSWQLIFLAPPVITAILSISRFALPMPVNALVIIMVGGYWLLMWVMGYVKFHWRSLPVVDWFIVAISLYTIANFYRYPVSINALGAGGDMVGGKDYFICFVSVLSYIVLSALPWRLETLLKCVKWSFYLGLALGSVTSVYSMLCPGAEAVGEEAIGAGEVLEHGRFAYFVAPGMMVLTYFYFRYPFVAIMTSLRRLLGSLLGVCCVMVSGWRTRMVLMFVQIAFIALAKREMTVLLLIGMAIYTGLFGLGSMGALESAPYGLQRVLTAVPGIDVSKKAMTDATGSSDIRVKMWKNALDPRTGLIKDYIWGDGFQTSLSEIMRDTTFRMRKGQLNDLIHQDHMQRYGSWHNGWITYLHRLGIVGLVLLQTFMLVSVAYLFHLTKALVRIPDGVYAYIPMCEFLGVAMTSSFLVWTVGSAFRIITQVALVKVFYCLLQERGMLKPMFVPTQYVPMTIREMEQQTQTPLS